MESQVGSLNTNIKTIMHKHASNSPVGTVIDDESGVGMSPHGSEIGDEMIHPHDGSSDTHDIISKLDSLANKMKDEIKTRNKNTKSDPKILNR